MIWEKIVSVYFERSLRSLRYKIRSGNKNLAIIWISGSGEPYLLAVLVFFLSRFFQERISISIIEPL